MRPAPGAPWHQTWAWTDGPGLESVAVQECGDELVAKGSLLAWLDGVVVRLDYSLVYDLSWQFRHGELRATTGDGEAAAAKTLSIAREGAGWRVDGVPRPDLAACVDVDVMTTPLTNTPPLWWLALAAGEARAQQVAYVRVPELTVSAVGQEYRRLDDGDPPTRFRYRNLATGWQGDLRVDERRMVLEYGPWRAVLGS